MPDQNQWSLAERREQAYGFILFGSSLFLGLSIIYSGVTDRLPGVNSWELILRVFGPEEISYWVWGLIYVLAGAVGSVSVIAYTERTRIVGTISSTGIGVASFTMLVFSVLAWTDHQTVPVWSVLFIYLSANATLRAITHPRRILSDAD